jgi:hypothetical protein
MDLLSLLPIGIVLFVVSIWEFMKFIFYPSIAILSLLFLFATTQNLIAICNELRDLKRIISNNSTQTNFETDGLGLWQKNKR